MDKIHITKSDIDHKKTKMVLPEVIGSSCLRTDPLIVACHMSEKGPRSFWRGKSNLKTVLESL